jgi:hypothetical protein
MAILIAAALKDDLSTARRMGWLRGLYHHYLKLSAKCASIVAIQAPKGKPSSIDILHRPKGRGFQPRPMVAL